MRASLGVPSFLIALVATPARVHAEDDESRGVLEELAEAPRDHAARWALLRNDRSKEARAALVEIAKEAPELLAEGTAGRKLAIVLAERSAELSDEASEVFLCALLLAVADEKPLAKSRVLSSRNRGTILRALAESRHPLALRTLTAWTRSENADLARGARDALSLDPNDGEAKPLTTNDLAVRSPTERSEILRAVYRGHVTIPEKALSLLAREEPAFALRLAALGCTRAESIRSAALTLGSEFLEAREASLRSAAALALSRCSKERGNELLSSRDRIVADAARSAHSVTSLAPPSEGESISLGTTPKNPRDALLFGRALGHAFELDETRALLVRKYLGTLRDHDLRAFVRGLAESGAKGLFPVLAEKYEAEDDPFVRAAIVAALVRFRGFDHPLLQDIARYDPSQACRTLARRSLGEFDGASEFSTLDFSTRTARFWLTRIDGAPFEVTPAPDGFVVVFGIPTTPADIEDRVPLAR